MALSQDRISLLPAMRKYAQEFQDIFDFKDGDLVADSARLAQVESFCNGSTLFIHLVSGIRMPLVTFRSDNGPDAQRQNNITLLQVYSPCYVTYQKVMKVLKLPVPAKFKLTDGF